MTSDGYAGRRLDILARDRARFGAGSVAELPEVLASMKSGSAFVVTDAGVVGSGVAARVVDLLRDGGCRVELYDGVEPNPGTSSITRGSDRLEAFVRGSPARSDVVVVALGGGSAMDSAKVIALHAANQRAVMALGYHDETLLAGFPVVAIATEHALRSKMISNIQQVEARGGEVIAVVTEGDAEIASMAGAAIEIPRVGSDFEPIVVTIALQLLAYHVAVSRGCDVDQPRNLAKTVTVE